MDKNPLKKVLSLEEIKKIKKEYARNKTIEEIAAKLKLDPAIVRIQIKLELKKNSEELLKDPIEPTIKELWSLNFLEEEVFDRYYADKESDVIIDDKSNWVKALSLALNVSSARAKLLLLNERFAKELGNAVQEDALTSLLSEISGLDSASILNTPTNKEDTTDE